MKKIIIIGAGVAGLSMGVYARVNGFDTRIFEMHNLPGGVCSSWKRGQYLFDHCLHWVLGSNTDSSLYPVFKELGIHDAVIFHYPQVFRHIEAYGKTLNVFTDLDKLKNELLNLFPDEKKTINKYLGLVKFYTRFDPPLDADFGNFGLLNFLKILPFMPSFFKLKSITVEQYLEIFHSNEIKEFLFQLFPVKKMPAIMAIMPLAFFHNQAGGYPLGGSLNFARAIERQFIGLGGQVIYKTRVKRVIVEQGRAAGIETETGAKEYADIVISCCDGRTTIFEMLDGKFITPQITHAYENPDLWPPLISISLGVNRDLSNYAEINQFKLETPVVIAGNKVEWLGFFHFCHDPAFAPKGKSVIKVQFETDFQYWKKLAENRLAYQEEKEKILNLCIDLLDKRLPGLKHQIEAKDIATPVTWERYTGNWQGSYQGWLPTVETFGKFLPNELPGLENFFMTGQWVFPGGGVPQCMAQARRLIKQICKKEKKPFQTVVNASPKQ